MQNPERADPSGFLHELAERTGLEGADVSARRRSATLGAGVVGLAIVADARREANPSAHPVHDGVGAALTEALTEWRRVADRRRLRRALVALLGELD